MLGQYCELPHIDISCILNHKPIFSFRTYVQHYKPNCFVWYLPILWISVLGQGGRGGITVVDVGCSIVLHHEWCSTLPPLLIQFSIFHAGWCIWWNSGKIIVVLTDNLEFNWMGDSKQLLKDLDQITKYTSIQLYHHWGCEQSAPRGPDTILSKWGCELCPQHPRHCCDSVWGCELCALRLCC